MLCVKLNGPSLCQSPSFVEIINFQIVFALIYCGKIQFCQSTHKEILSLQYV